MYKNVFSNRKSKRNIVSIKLPLKKSVKVKKNLSKNTSKFFIFFDFSATCCYHSAAKTVQLNY